MLVLQPSNRELGKKEWKEQQYPIENIKININEIRLSFQNCLFKYKESSGINNIIVIFLFFPFLSRRKQRAYGQLDTVFYVCVRVCGVILRLSVFYL